MNKKLKKRIKQFNEIKYQKDIQKELSSHNCRLKAVANGASTKL